MFISFSLCDDEKLDSALFSCNIYIKARDEFRVEIIKIENIVEL